MKRALLDFVKLEAQSCTFAFVVVALLALSRVLPLGTWGVARYDFLLLGVPLYAGFMYASVGSYMAQAWKRCRLTLRHAPPLGWQIALAGAAYLNFFTHHYGPDLRYVISGAMLAAFWRTRAAFVVAHVRREMPLPLAFLLIGVFIFLAENIATGLGAWVYPHQVGAWHPVHLGKLLSWTLMVVVALST